MDTIAAISTAPGIGGIGIVRISGEETIPIIKKIFKPKKEFNMDTAKGYTIKYGHIINKNEIIDEVLVSFFRNPNSYTKEDLCEISSHGGTYVLRKILETCLENGATLAEPGEFTKRAFLNGRIDLSQAEAVIDIINSTTDKEAKNSVNQLEGVLSTKIKDIRKLLMDVMVDIEVNIDYPEYDVEEVGNSKITDTLNKVEEKLNNLVKSFENGKLIKDGIKIALIGKPNAGKSSLLNAILNEERAIVTDIEGTTRDTIEEAINISGIPVHIIDTAGIRNATNEVEKIGIEKSKKIAKDADVVIAIFDISTTLNEEDKEILEILQNKKSMIVLNKIDLENPKIDKKDIEKILDTPTIIEISVKQNIGIDNIYDEISKMFKLSEISLDNSAIITNLRHKEIIKKALENTKKAIEVANENIPTDIIRFIYKRNIRRIRKNYRRKCIR